MKSKNLLSKSILFIAGLLTIISCNTSNNNRSSDVTLFKNGTVLTVDHDFSVVEALAIDGNKIIAIGTEDEVLNEIGSNYKTYDLEGKTLLPGFIDAHAHMVAGGVVDHIMEYVGMERFRTTDEVLVHLKEMASKKNPGEWISARNWDPSIQDGPNELTSQDLNLISTVHPILILNASGHLAYANSKAFEIAGIDNHVQNPEGAEFVKDKNGVLTGVMKNMTAYIQVAQANPALRNSDPSEGILNMAKKVNEVGITTSSELALGSFMGSTVEIDLMMQISESGKLKTRIRAYPSYVIEKSMDSSKYKMNDGNEIFRLSGYKLVADGSNQGFTGLQRAPYHCCGGHGIAYTSPEELDRLVLDKAKQGWQLAIHGNGDKGIDNILNSLEKAKNKGIDLETVRPRIEHASIIHNDQIKRMKELKVSASFLIGHVYYWGTFMRDSVFGPEKVLLLDRAASLEKEGVGFSLHSDFMVTNPNPLHMLEMAVTRRTWKEPEYILAPEERISVQSAIRAITSEAAWQLMSEHEIGSLEVGKFADMVILDKDPRSVDSDMIKDIKVIETWINGEKVFSLSN